MTNIITYREKNFCQDDKMIARYDVDLRRGGRGESFDGFANGVSVGLNNFTE